MLRRRARQARIDELCLQQERNSTTVSQMMVQIRELQNKVNSLSDARKFYDPESGSSSGATYVPGQPSTLPSPKTMPRCDSGLLHDTRKFTGITGNVFERPHAQASTILNNAKNLASSSQGVRPDITETARKEMKRESLNTSTQSPHFQSGSGMLNHTGGACFHGGMMDYPSIRFTEWNLGKFPDFMEVQSWKENFRTEVCLRTADRDRLQGSTIFLTSTCLMR